MADVDAEIRGLKARIARAEGRIGLLMILLAVSVGILLVVGVTCHGLLTDRLMSLQFASEHPPIEDRSKVIATSFVLKDASGHDRISMGVLPDNSVYFGVTDPKGIPQWLFLGGKDSVALSLASGEKIGVMMAVESKGDASVAVGIDHKVTLSTATDYRGAKVVVTGGGENVIGHLP
jgi:hypothetical protein